MKHLKLKQKAFELFEEGGDIDSVAYDLGIDEAQSEIWFKEYNVEQSLAGLSDDPEQVQELLEAIQELNGLKREEINLYAKEKEEAELKERKLCMIT